MSEDSESVDNDYLFEIEQLHYVKIKIKIKNFYFLFLEIKNLQL